jgi:glycosyltransferase involved in cell wall biosynthesis
MQAQPLVSIIIPTYNRKHYVFEAIDSCLAQTYSDCEIIVVDDGSRDDTEIFLRNRYGGQIRYIYQDNQGPGIARNTGIASAKGELIQFCDADDQLVNNKIQLCVDYLQTHPDVAVVHTYYQFVASDGKTPIETPPFPQFTDDLFCNLLKLTGNHILISSTMVRKSALDDVGAFPQDIQHRSAEDWDMFLRLSSKYKFHGIPEKLVLRRTHPDMMSDDLYYGALGRLKTIQNARDYNWKTCLSEADFNRIEAARYHMFALALWQRGNRQEARQAFLQAVEIYPPFALQRRLYALYTYALPPESVDWTMRSAQQIKDTLKSTQKTLRDRI